MVYIQHWHEYASGVKALQEHSNGQVRFCSRWRHSKGLLILKATDNERCLLFRTRSALYLNRFQVLMHEIMAGMQSKKPIVNVLSKAVHEPVAVQTIQHAGEGAESNRSPNPLAKKKKSKKSKK